MDFQHIKEEQKLQAKRDKLSNIHEHRKTQFFGSSIEKKSFQSGLNQVQFMHLQLQNKMKNDQQTRNRQEEYYHEQVQQKKHQDYLDRIDRIKSNEKQLMYENTLLVQEKSCQKDSREI